MSKYETVLDWAGRDMPAVVSYEGVKVFTVDVEGLTRRFGEEDARQFINARLADLGKAEAAQALARKVAALNPEAGEIGAGMLAGLVAMAKNIVETPNEN